MKSLAKPIRPTSICTMTEKGFSRCRGKTVERELKLCGYFCIITSEKMTAHRPLIQYKGRDISEKLFRSDKTFIGARSERTPSAQSTSSRIFIEFIALIVRNRIYNLLKEQVIKMESRYKYLTVPAAIRELEKIENGPQKWRYINSTTPIPEHRK